jgi:hypothetical protein
MVPVSDQVLPSRTPTSFAQVLADLSMSSLPVEFSSFPNAERSSNCRICPRVRDCTTSLSLVLRHNMYVTAAPRRSLCILLFSSSLHFISEASHKHGFTLRVFHSPALHSLSFAVVAWSLFGARMGRQRVGRGGNVSLLCLFLLLFFVSVWVHLHGSCCGRVISGGSRHVR